MNRKNTFPVHEQLTQNGTDRTRSGPIRSHYGSRAIPREGYNLLCASVGLTTHLRAFLLNSESTSEFYACELGGYIGSRFIFLFSAAGGVETNNGMKMSIE